MRNYSRPRSDSILAILSEHLFQELFCLWPMCTLTADRMPDDQCHRLNTVHPQLVLLSLCQVPDGRHEVLVTRGMGSSWPRATHMKEIMTLLLKKSCQ